MTNRADLRPIDVVAQQDLQQLLLAHPLDELRDMRLLITGVTGFFGYWLLTAIDLLNAAGHRLEVVSLSRQPLRFARSHPRLATAPWLRIDAGDLRNARLPEGPFDAILHAASDTSTTAASAPLLLFDNILTGTRRTLQLAADIGCPRVLLVSSGAVYGVAATSTPVAEHHPCVGNPLNPADAYAAGKRAMEMLAACMHQSCGLDVVVARCFAFVGAGLPLDGHFAIGNFIRDALADRPIEVRGSGRALRSYLYAADLVVWLLTILLRGKSGEAYNVGSDQAYSICEVAGQVRDNLAPALPIHVADRQASEPRPSYVPDITRARSTLGLDVWTPLPVAIRRTAASAGHAASIGQADAEIAPTGRQTTL